MAILLTRTQILLEPEQHRALTEMARQQNRSLSELMRTIIRDELERQAAAQAGVLRQRQQALQRIAQHGAAIIERRRGEPLISDVGEEIRQLREERDEQIFHTLAIHRG